MALGSCAHSRQQLISKRPERWDARLTVQIDWNAQLIVLISDQNGFTELSIKQRDTSNKSAVTEETLCVEKLSPSDLSYLYAAVIETLQQFRFIDDLHPGRLDGGHATIELRINKRSLSAGFAQYADYTELPASLRKVMKFADARLAKQPIKPRSPQ